MRKMMMCWIAGCVNALALSVQLLAADQPLSFRSFDAEGDNFMYSADAYASVNWGAHGNLIAGMNNSTDRYRSLMRFDLASVNDAASVSSASLTLTVASTGKVHSDVGNMELRLLLIDTANKDWVEGTANTAVQSGSACWSSLAEGSREWTGGPGVGHDTASAGISAVLSSVSVDTASVAVGDTVTFTIDSAEGLAAIASWIQGGDNAGFLLVTDETAASQNALIFHSSEVSDESVRPALTVQGVGINTAFEGLDVDETNGRVSLWSVPKAADLKPVDGVAFRAIKAYEPQNDGYEWLHGVGLAWHKGQLYASFGHNTGAENTEGESAHYRISDDGGQTWGDVKSIADGEGSLSISHGVFLSYVDQLWAFQGAFSNDFENTHTRAYLLNETTGQWEYQGVVIEDGFWPMQQPEKMDDGNWVMAGICAPDGYPASSTALSQNLPAVAISHGDDFMNWDLIVIPAGEGVGSVWGESGVVVDGANLTMISRWWWQTPYALVAESSDFGRSWTELQASNMPMAASKPCTGILSTGQHYLIANISSDGGNSRTPLSIAYSRPGAAALSEIRLVRHSVQDNVPWSEADCKLSYPCAIEKDGMLYIGYSNSAFGEGVNNNNAELAVIPISELQ
ncbi:DNRLRE domain-containing protein [Tichowtungia aerotolerans]|uniref:DNRLRE domain-containing protein n=1 Tax=Tichowtungia aerotolerans TaxID=2697043 RepID=A0A6P1M357_9BACT|nr:DNRLRE domain-containing protein [Tichowtungia aerotolerans]QHI68532.1 DNRLRE domain-containing protein [Tichowtungia aerotolerans]